MTRKKVKRTPVMVPLKHVGPIEDVKGAIEEIKVTDSVKADSLSAEIVPPEEGDAETPSVAYLRYSAGITYTTNMDGLTLKELHEMPMFKDLSMSQLTRWQGRDRWNERRKEILERWREQLEKKVGTEIVQARIADMRRLEGLYSKAIRKLENDFVPVGTWEGMAGAVVRLGKTLDEMRQRIGQDLIPQMGLGDGNKALALPAAKFEASEIRAAAMTIIESRRAKIRGTESKPASEAPREPQGQVEGEDGGKVDKTGGSGST